MDNFTRFWEAYPNKKAKGDASKAWDKIKPDDDLTTKIILAIAAQKKWRAAAHSANQFVPNWKHPAVWLRSQCWLDEIGSHSDLKEKQNETITFCQCGKKATQQDSLCAWCWSKKYSTTGPTSLDVLRRAYRKSLPRIDGETPGQYLKRCLGKSKAGSMGKDKAVSWIDKPAYTDEDSWNVG